MLVSLLVIFLVLIFAGTPVAFAMGLTSLSYFALNPEIPILTIPQRMMHGGYSFSLLAIPFFILAGEIMNRGGITKRLVDFAQGLIGWMTGGLAQVNILSGVFMAGMSGSAVADAAAISSVMIPAMEGAGYPRSFSSALTAASSTVGPIIPPSIPFVVLGSMTGLSVSKLFLGGVVPGLIMALYMMVATYLISRRRGYGKAARVSAGALLKSFVITLPVMALPVLIVGGILMGYFTATEASVAAVVYALLLGVVVYREITWRELPSILAKTAVTTATILFILSVANSLSWVLAREQLGVQLVDLITGISQNPVVVLLLVNAGLLVLGMFLEPLVIITLLIPFLMPLMQSLGIDLIHAGVVIVVNLMIGLITPPVGALLFVTSRVAQISIEDLVGELGPYMIALIMALLTITLYPPLVTWLPGLLR